MFKYLILATIIYFIYKSMEVKKIENSSKDKDDVGYSDYEELE
jgi:hypothetical protein